MEKEKIKEGEVDGQVEYQEIDLVKEFTVLQGVLREQEIKYFELSKEKDDYYTKCIFLEKRDKEKKEETLKMMSELIRIEEAYSKHDDEIFSLRCIKNKYEEKSALSSILREEQMFEQLRH